jgi:hypothetical protein
MGFCIFSGYGMKDTNVGESDVVRYTCVASTLVDCMEEDNEGKYVLFEDYKALYDEYVDVKKERDLLREYIHTGS